MMDLWKPSHSYKSVLFRTVDGGLFSSCSFLLYASFFLFLLLIASTHVCFSLRPLLTKQQQQTPTSRACFLVLTNLVHHRRHFLFVLSTTSIYLSFSLAAFTLSLPRARFPVTASGTQPLCSGLISQSHIRTVPFLFPCTTSFIFLIHSTFFLSLFLPFLFFVLIASPSHPTAHHPSHPTTGIDSL